MSHADISNRRILQEFEHYLRSRGYKPGYHFDPWERETKREWKPALATAFVIGFLERNGEFSDFRLEVYNIALDVGNCYKITP